MKSEQAGGSAARPPDMAADVLRALRISGRRLVEHRPGVWSVFARGDRRARRLATVDDDTVARLRDTEQLQLTSDGDYVLPDGVIAPPPPSASGWAFIAAGRPRRKGEPGKGFLGLAVLARRGAGPLSMRQVKAGMRLIADAEREHNSAGLTMNWSSGPTDKRQRGPQRGGQTSSAAEAAARLKRVRALAGGPAWRLAWLACVEGATLLSIKAQTGLTQRSVGKELALALEQLANAYER